MRSIDETSINVIGYYQNIMYEALGFSEHTTLLVSGIYNCVGPVTSKFCLKLVILELTPFEICSSSSSSSIVSAE
jgi:hypothetical protein